MSAQESPTRAEVANAVDRIARRPELDGEPTLLERAFEWMRDHLLPSAGPETFGVIEGVVQWLSVIMLAAIVALIAIAIMRRVRSRRAREAPGEAIRSRVLDLLRRAGEARAQGDLALALRLYLFALVVGLGQKGDLQYRDAWTNRELVERGKPSARVRELLLPLVFEMEAKEFGRDPVVEADVDRLAEACAKWLGAGGQA